MFEAVDRVMKNKRGGAVPRRTQIGGQDHMLSYITPTEAEILMQLGGSGEPGPAGIPAFFDPGERDQLGGAQGGRDVTGRGGDTGPERGDDKPSGKSYSDLGMSPGQAQAQFGTIGPALFAGAQQDQIADSGFRAKALSDYRDLGVGKGFFGRPTYNSTYNTQMAKNYVDLVNRQFGTPSQKEFNEAMGITLDNPYGYDGVFSGTFGIDPRNISYSNHMSAQDRADIANNQFSKYANPTNQPGKIGYNPDFPTAEPGFLRSGVQKKGFDTTLGIVQEFAKKRSPEDMLAIAGIGALNPAFGILAEALTDTTYGLSGLAPPDAAPPGEPQTFTGQAFAAVTEGIKAAYDAARETLGDLADRLTPEQAKAVAEATPEQQEQIKSELQQQQINGVTIGTTPSGRTTLTMPDGRVTTMNPDGTLTGFSSASSIQAKTAQGAPVSSVEAQAAQDAQNLGLASLGIQDPEVSGVPMSGTVPSKTLGSLVDALPDAPSLSMQSIPGFTQDALTADQNPFIFGGGDGPDRPTQEETETEEDDTLYSYDPKITGEFYDYGQPPTFDGRILIPTEEVLKDRFNLVI